MAVEMPLFLHVPTPQSAVIDSLLVNRATILAIRNTLTKYQNHYDRHLTSLTVRRKVRVESEGMARQKALRASPLITGGLVGRLMQGLSFARQQSGQKR